MDSLKYGTINIEFEVERKASLKHSYIKVDGDGVLVKTNLWTTRRAIRKMVESKAAWICKKRELFQLVAIDKNIRTGSRLYYIGKSYYVNLIEDDCVNKIAINFTHSKFHITVPPTFSDDQLDKSIDSFYKQKAIEKIVPLTQKWAKKMEVTPEHIGFRASKKRWGSCSGANRISFNYHLIKLSSSLIEYVVIHELAHIRYHNHSKDFWTFVHSYLDDYKVRLEKLRVFEKLL